MKKLAGLMAVAMVGVVALSGSAWANVIINGTGYGLTHTISSGSHSNVDIRNDSGFLSGTLNQTGGAITGSLRLGYGLWSADGETDIYNLSAGTMSATADQNLGSEGGAFNSATVVELNVSGTGAFSNNGSTMRLGDGGGSGVTATVTVSDEGIFDVNGYLQFGDGNSYFEVTGGDATISVEAPWMGGNSGAGNYAVGGFDFNVDNTGISPIAVGNNDLDLSNAGNAGVIDMELLGGYTPAQDQVFDIMTTPEGKQIFLPGGGANALLDAGDVGTWSLAVVTEAGQVDKLQATYLLSSAPPVPEPASAVLVFLGFGAVASRLRRRLRAG